MGKIFLDNRVAQLLSTLRPLLYSERGSIALYAFRGFRHRALMQEVGRLRERAFRAAGGGTGQDVDVDADDFAEDGYKQLIAWDLRREQIVGGYRYIRCSARSMGHISTLHYFRPSPQFVALYLPHAIEVGRSFVSPLPDRHPLFAMEALWQGLGRVVSAHASVRYMFGKVTLYRDYDDEARRLLMLFLRKFFPPQSPLLQARTPFVEREGDDPFTMEFFDDNYTLLRRLLHRYGEQIPPMINAYMRLSRRMQVFDTVINTDFGNTYETALLMPIDDVKDVIRQRYLI